MVEFLKKFESRDIKSKLNRVNSSESSKLNLHHKIDQFTWILYGVEVHCDRMRFSVHSSFIEKSMVKVM